MKERPILFSGPMVRAILEGRKSQTRRVVKPTGKDDGFVLLDHGKGWWPYRSDDGESSMHTVRRRGALYLDETPMTCPYGQPGDRLWVREAWQRGEDFETTEGMNRPQAGKIYYRAEQDANPFGFTGIPWRPSIHMPRWASRLTLEVTGVRVERLQDISEGDCWDEGIEEWLKDDKNLPSYRDGTPAKYLNIRQAYAALWESINGPGSWAANPWVWVIEFRRAK